MPWGALKGAKKAFKVNEEALTHSSLSPSPARTSNL